MTVIERFLDACKQYDFSPSDRQMEQFKQYFQLLVEWNEKINLTAIVDEEGVYFKHFFDSLTLGFHHSFSSDTHIIDVGAGAGFPSIPLKIMLPDIKVTILDSLNKRITFLNTIVESLGLQNVSLIHGRAEEAGQNKLYREKFDVATARAVARLSVLSEYCMPFVRKDGYFLAMKGAGAENEVSEGKKAISTLGGTIENSFSFELPFELGERSIIEVKKVKPTPKQYPRKAGLPSKDPIQ